jgi:energy-coupling factor transporter ATP-binding protein EcfA2
MAPPPRSSPAETGAPPRATAAEKGKGPASGSGGGAAAKPRGDAGAFEAARDPRLARAAKLVDAQLQAEASAVGTLKWVADKFQRQLAAEPNWATGPLKAARTAELAALAQKCVLPHSTTVLVGNTGAGKSTLLNALLGEWGVLPTNGMRACTAALMELSFCHETDGPAYRADVEFYGRREWEEEEEALFADLTGPDGRVALSVSDPNSHLYVSWCKLHAVYGDAFTHSRVVDTAGGRGPDGRARYLNPMADDLKEKLHACRRITGALGTVRHLASDDARVFRRDVEAYCDSSNEHAASSFWPLVRRVRLCSRKWGVLKSGAVLVDAPGVNDDNSARDGIVKAYLRDADAIWIVSNIKRAVNDKAAKTMLGESFRRQLLMDGQYGQLVFVASQSDGAISLWMSPHACACADQRAIHSAIRSPGSQRDRRQPAHAAQHAHRAAGCGAQRVHAPAHPARFHRRPRGDVRGCGRDAGPRRAGCSAPAACVHGQQRGLSEAVWRAPQRRPAGRVVRGGGDGASRAAPLRARGDAASPPRAHREAHGVAVRLR